MITDWLAFWDSPHCIYVSARHKDVHYRLIATEIAALVPSPQARVIDYGSGEALHADLIAAAAGQVLLCEAAPGVREGLQKRFAGDPKIRVIAPYEIARLPEHSLDLIVLHSVAAISHRRRHRRAVRSVSSAPEIRRPACRQRCHSAGDPRRRPTRCRSCALVTANGFFFAALWGLIRTLVSDYWRLRSHVGLTRYANGAMIEKLNAAGFDARRAPTNIGHNQARRAYYAQPR